MVESDTRTEVERRIAEGDTVRDIAVALGLSTQAVYGHLRRAGIEPPTRASA